MNNRESKEEVLFTHGRYSVCLLKEPFEDDEYVLQNYGVYNGDVCEATSGSYPQAINIAVALDRAIDQTMESLGSQEASGAANEVEVAH